MFNWFRKKEFRPQNALAALAHVQTAAQIKYGKLKYPQGKLECYIFYSTYISLLTSHVTPLNTDTVDQLLVNGIWGYKNFLEIEDDSYLLGFASFLDGRAKFYTESIKAIIDNFNSNDDRGASIPNFVLLFRTEEEKGIDEVDSSDLFKIMEDFAIVKVGLRTINHAYYECLQVAGVTGKQGAKTNTFFEFGNFTIDQLVIYPFRRPICERCGSIKKRQELELFPCRAEFGTYLLPVCSDCKARYAIDGRIE